MNSYIRIGAAVLAALSLSACATVTRGTKQTFKVVSTPSEADVELSTGEKCKTPCKLKLKRKKEFTVTVSKPGYVPVKTDIQSKFTGGVALAGNALIGGLIGGGVDASNGSLNSLKPNPLEVTLVAADATAVAPAAPAPAGASDAPVPPASAPASTETAAVAGATTPH